MKKWNEKRTNGNNRSMKQKDKDSCSTFQQNIRTENNIKKPKEADFQSSMDEELLNSRKIVLSRHVDAKLANTVVKQLLFLEKKDPKKPITLFINSPGGEIHSGFAIYDIMQFIKPKIKTVVIGFAASMGSIIALGADVGHRYALPNAMFLIHQPLISGVYEGSVTDIQIQAKEMINIKNRIIHIYVQATGKTYEEIKKDINRDFWITANEALNYGSKKLVDQVITSSISLDSE